MKNNKNDKDEELKICYKFSMTLKFLVEIGCFICVCILCSMSSKNPLENHLIGNLSNYFLDTVYDTALNINKSTNNNGIFNHISTNVSIYNGNKTISSEKDIKKKERKLVSDSFCSEIYNNFVKYKGTKLSNIFDFNYDKIRKISIAHLLVNIFFIICFILVISIGAKIKNECLSCLLSFFSLASYVASFVLSIILFYYIEKSDIEKYDNFLDCKRVKVKFFNKLTSVNKLRKCFMAFLVMNIIIQGIDKIENCIQYAEMGEE